VKHLKADKLELWVNECCFVGYDGESNKLKATFLSLCYMVCNADEVVFYQIENDGYTIVAAATDNFTIITSSTECVKCIKTQLNNHFELVDLGEINWLLGIHIQHVLAFHTISLSQ